MPYKNLERRALARRGYVRTYRHKNWRQVYIDCDGMCQFPVDEVVCGVMEFLEFHEPFGELEVNGLEVKFQQRVLLCPDHHAEVEGFDVQDLIKGQWQGSMLQGDVALEIALCGSVEQWLDRYALITNQN